MRKVLLALLYSIAFSAFASPSDPDYQHFATIPTGTGGPLEVYVAPPASEARSFYRLSLWKGESHYETEGDVMLEVDTLFSRDTMPRFRKLDLRAPGAEYYLMTTWSAGGCNYDVVQVTADSVKQMLSVPGEAECTQPEVEGATRINFFYAREQYLWLYRESYVLSTDGSELVEAPESSYHVPEKLFRDSAWFYSHVGALRSFRLEGAECGSRSVAKGTYLRVTFYDAGRKAFRFEGLNGECGWVKKSVIEAEYPNLFLSKP